MEKPYSTSDFSAPGISLVALASSMHPIYMLAGQAYHAEYAIVYAESATFGDGFDNSRMTGNSQVLPGEFRYRKSCS